MYRDIGDYGLIGDMHSVALVSKDGSIDYCSMPHIDSPTVFAALLDDEKGGFFKIQPESEFRSEQCYIKDTNIIKCDFNAAAGKAELFDFMPVKTEELFEEEEHSIHRSVKLISGEMTFMLELYARPRYAAEVPTIDRANNMFKIKSGSESFTLVTDLDRCEINSSSEGKLFIRFRLKEGETAYFDFIYGDKSTHEFKDHSLEETKVFWLDWLHNCAAGQCSFFFEHTDMINRSLLTLKLLTFQPTGAIAAAATTSLPESLGGERNWDYRFTWIRDASFTLKAMFALAHIAEADSFIRWLHDVYSRYGSRNMQIMYSLEGEKDLKEVILKYLKGYRNSRPVRIGNGAFNQRQLDIYGEVMDAAMRLSDYAGKIDEGLWPFFRDICDTAARNWKQPDDGIWEVRNGPSHFVYSKVMCWVALDRGVRISKRYGFGAPLDVWQREKDAIMREVLEKGYDTELNSFVQRYGSKDLDSSLLLLALMNFLPINDTRIQGTIEACKRYLMKDGFLLRYKSNDGLEGEEGGFLLCNFWLVECLALSGKLKEARELLSRTVKAANHLGLFSEEYDYRNKTLLGNFPQAFSHIGYINAVSAILNIHDKISRQAANDSLVKRIQKLIPTKVVLNRTDDRIPVAEGDIAARLKISLNHMQGSFFDVLEGRVNYERMRMSASYKSYLGLAGKLNGFDPFSLKGDDEKKAFWINIYNIMIIHGIIDLNVKSSVKEVFNFFGRIGYLIGGLFMAPDDIEHGILRGNRAHPVTGLKQFSVFDNRKKLCVSKIDPRIHFALVCASSSCPPIEFYDAAKIDNQLDTAARSFINRKGMALDKDRPAAQLSQIFKWYTRDFGGSEPKILKYASGFADEAARKFILDNKTKIKVEYLPYNWNLNKTLE